MNLGNYYSSVWTLFMGLRERENSSKQDKQKQNWKELILRCMQNLKIPQYKSNYNMLFCLMKMIIFFLAMMTAILSLNRFVSKILSFTVSACILIKSMLHQRLFLMEPAIVCTSFLLILMLITYLENMLFYLHLILLCFRVNQHCQKLYNWLIQILNSKHVKMN